MLKNAIPAEDEDLVEFVHGKQPLLIFSIFLPCVWCGIWRMEVILWTRCHVLVSEIWVSGSYGEGRLDMFTVVCSLLMLFLCGKVCLSCCCYDERNGGNRCAVAVYVCSVRSMLML